MLKCASNRESESLVDLLVPARLRAASAPGRGASVAAVAAAAGFAAQGVDAFLADDGHHRECGQRVRPPPSEKRVEQQSAQYDGGEVHAEFRLARVGPQGAAAQAG